MANLSPEEKTQLKAAHDKAIEADPTLDQKMRAAHEAMEAARQAMHDAMIKIDPSVAPILEKIAPKKWGKPGDPEEKHKDWGTNAPASNDSAMAAPREHADYGKPSGFSNLTPEEQAQLKADYKKVKNDPTVVAAKAAEKAATTPEARKEAREALRKASSLAMLKVDPSIAPILEKIHPPTPTAQEHDGEEMPPPPQ